MENLKIGTSVDIKRSDGRIHSAMVSGINKETSTITVEWFEKGETKGKEIDYEQLLGLNPSLLTFAENDAENFSAPVPGALSITNSRERLLSDDDKNNKKRRQTNVQPLPLVTKPVQNGKPKANADAISKTKHKMSTTVVSNGYDEEEDDDDFGLINNNGAGRTVAGQAAAKRKSHTVQEIERLKKNREERRAKQEELRLHKQELMNVEPGNPNWEFMAMIKEYRDKLDYHPLRVNDAIEDHQICVCVRKRPLNKKEIARKEVEMTTIPNRDHVIIHQPQTKVDLTKYLENQTFRFDYAFDDSASNEMVYRFTAQPLIKTIFEQGFATCFAYGQTGSGKTHTMGGDFHGKTQEVAKGIYAMTARDVFRLYNKNYKKDNLVVSCSFFEIYSGKVFDLLNNKAKLRILEDGKQQVQVVGLQEIIVNDEHEVLELIKRGSDVRTAGQTSANNQSSRSHAVFQIILRKKGVKKLHGKFSLIDLAGNERGADTVSSDRTTRMEGAEINKSLLALKECIRALGRKNAHLPFRASKLTLVLRDSFIGDNARTCMIAMISPGMNSVEHTLNTLRYADRVKELGTEDPEIMLKNANNVADDLESESSDLALLHSHNEEELSEELYNLQMAMDQMQEQEEKLLDEHSKVFEDMKKDLEDHRKLLKLTETVDYDTEAYAKKFRSLLDSQLVRIMKVRELADEFIGQLQQEELAAQKAGGSKKSK